MSTETLDRPATSTAIEAPVPVTVDNYVRAETDIVFSQFVPDGFGKFRHYRDLAPIDDRIVQRPNRDTVYSSGLFDLDAGPVTITLPDAGERFRSMTVFSEDHYTSGSVYGRGRHTVRKEDVGTRYALVVLRTMVNPANPDDLLQVHALQDATGIEQVSSGTFETPNWDRGGRKKIADALTVLGSTLRDWTGAAGREGTVDPVRHLIVTATGWGLNLAEDATYLNITPERNDGNTVYRLLVGNVPVDGFWSISLYNAEGYFQANPQNAYSLNSHTAKKEADGSVMIQFGGCDGAAANCLPTTPGWNYTVRLYRPRTEILNGSWRFPEAQPVS